MTFIEEYADFFKYEEELSNTEKSVYSTGFLENGSVRQILEDYVGKYILFKPFTTEYNTQKILIEIYN